MLETKVKRRRTTELPPQQRSYKDDPSALLQYETLFCWDNTVVEKSSFNHDRLLSRGSNHYRELVWERNTRN